MCAVGAIISDYRDTYFICLDHPGPGSVFSPSHLPEVVIGRVSLARENEAGGRKSIFSMLTYRASFCFCL